MTKKESNIELEKAFAELYVSSAINLKNSTMNSIRLYDEKCKFIRNQIYTLKNEEPLKFFKKSHKNWENKLKKLKQKYDDSFTDFIGECKELEDIIELFNV